MITRLTLFAILVLSSISAMSGNMIASVGDLAAAYAIQCNDPRFFILSAATTVISMRIFGLVGFLLLAMGRVDAGKIFLSLHYGLTGIDDSKLPVAGRLAAGFAGLSLAV